MNVAVAQVTAATTTRSDHEGRQEAAGPPGPEVGKGDPPRPIDLGEDERRDQESRQHEEDVHAEEPGGEPRNLEMEQQHEDHGDRAHPVERVYVSTRCGVP